MNMSDRHKQPGNGNFIDNQRQDQTPLANRHYRRWLEGLCFVVVGFCFRTIFDLRRGFRQDFFPQLMNTSGQLEVKSDIYHTTHSSSTSSLKISTAIDSNYNTSPTVLKPMNETTGLEFIFTIGLEGTGHHLMSLVISKSPFMRQAKSMGLENYIVDAMRALFAFKQLNGLFNQACLDDSIYVKNGRKWKLSSNYDNEIPAAFDTVSVHNRMVKLLRGMQQIYDEKTANNPQPLRIPLSSFTPEGKRPAGMMSYPNAAGKCRMLHYPILDLLYRACAEANVQCSHVYVYRHPLDVLRSTTIKRHFNPPGMVFASHLYTSHLKIIQTQLLSYPGRNRGCFGFFDHDGSKEWQAPIQDMWGWTTMTTTDLNVSSFESFVQEKYRQPSSFQFSTSDNIIAGEVDGVFPVEHIPYLEVFLRAHEQTLEVCRQTAAIARLS